MRLNYSELKNFTNHIRTFFIQKEEWKFGKVQKIFSSGNMLCLNIRIPGKTLYLGVGRGGEDCGLFLLKNQIPSPYRIQKDNILEYLRSNCQGKNVINIECDENDKCIFIEFHDKSKVLFFWKGASLHFSHLYIESGHIKEYSPWKGQGKTTFEMDNDFDIFNDAGRKKLGGKPGKKDFLILEDSDFLKGKENKTTSNKLERKLNFIKKDLENCKLWSELQDGLIEDKFDLSEDKFKFKNFKVKFDPNDNYYQRKDIVFKKIKKLKIGEKILEQRYQAVSEQLDKSKESITVNQSITFPLWIKKSKKTNSKVRTEGAVFYKYNNISIAVGTSTTGNDYIRSNWAKKDDVWFHLDGNKSAHLIAKNILSLDLETISLLSSILAEHSGFDSSVIPVIYTKVSNLKGVKGSAGKVIYKKEKHLSVTKVNWKEIISSSSLE